MTSRTLSVLVANRPGTLAGISAIFAETGCNIDRIKVGARRNPEVARMRIATDVDDGRLSVMLDRIRSRGDVLKVSVRHAVREARSYSSVAYGLWTVILGVNLLTPLYSLYVQRWDLSPGDLALLFAAYAFAVIPLLLLSGPWAAKYGYRSALAAGIGFALASTVCFIYADGLALLLAGRIAQGAAVGIFNSLAVAVLTELDGKLNRQKAAYTAAMAVTAGNALGPLLSGMLAQYAVRPLLLPFLAYGALLLPAAAGMLVVRLGKPAAGTRPRWPRIRKGMRTAFLAAAATSFAVWSMVSLFMSLIPTYLGKWGGAGGYAVSAAMGTSVLVVSAISQRLLRDWPQRRVIAVGFALMAAAASSVAVAVRTETWPILAAAAAFTGLGHGPLYAASLSAVSRNATDATRAGSVSLYYVVTYLGVGLPVLGTGYAARHFGLTGSLTVFAGCMLFFIAVCAALWVMVPKSEVK